MSLRGGNLRGLLFDFILAEHLKDLGSVTTGWSHNLGLLDLVSDHKLSRVPFSDETQLLVRDEVLHVDVPRKTEGTVESTLNQVVLQTLLTGRERPAALCKTGLINQRLAYIALKRRWHIEFVRRKLFSFRRILVQ